MGRSLVAPYAGRRLLDYGCGDGTFLALVHDLFPGAAGADYDPQQTLDCVRRFAGVPGLTFTLTDQLRQMDHCGRYAAVTCMEVLEHCPDEERALVLQDLHRVTAPDGRVIISVPIETGPSLVVKHLFRTVLGWRNVGDYRYREHYGAGEFLKMVFAGCHTTIPRPLYRAEFDRGFSMRYHGHKGFNWRRLQREVEDLFEIERVVSSPVRWLGAALNSQVWMVCRPR
jgi:2-polyprenyl-3-methyl-5-hydroxy-6-metoxy-1,4-benzoquinol methylase